mmetsp:Transcript_16767/g.68589  ORF Transcript_16767/g.68589 Transcript_16767/m.68589 type:complete len:230 (-) Transcript_16767:565-1254(-)|eukprot:CAMPEP_0113955706 /NCGR_PEP_ID=MMETSP0011_2-20120614/1536_1 /TAXON_ID=101924 /ORGANISM="Rhodosorus marinus" /LENGTH=229 /DNA_ID=CAMNT_0000965533 /DNA_START=369 /DNA_END=1061 /DNA_ORIENTATION=+ /assembly_acc=CAM_ASM_000156
MGNVACMPRRSKGSRTGRGKPKKAQNLGASPWAECKIPKTFDDLEFEILDGAMIAKEKSDAIETVSNIDLSTGKDGQEKNSDVMSYLTSDENSSREDEDSSPKALTHGRSLQRVKEQLRKLDGVESVRIGGVEDSRQDDVGNLIDEFEKVTTTAKVKKVRVPQDPLAELGVSKDDSMMNFNEISSMFKATDEQFVQPAVEVSKSDWKQELPRKSQRMNFAELASRFQQG